MYPRMGSLNGLMAPLMTTVTGTGVTLAMASIEIQKTICRCDTGTVAVGTWGPGLSQRYWRGPRGMEKHHEGRMVTQ